MITETLKIKGIATFKAIADSMRRLERQTAKFGGGMTATFFKINQAFGAFSAAVAAFRGAEHLIEFRQEVIRLEKVVGRDLARALQASTGGTISQMEAMRSAAKGMGGELGLSASQMKTLFAAADDLGKQFGDKTTVIVDRLTEAFRKQRFTELPKYGIAVDKTRSKTEQLHQIFTQLQDRAANPKFADKAADNLDKTKAKIQDNADAVKNILGGAIGYVLQLSHQLILDFQDAVKELLGLKDLAEGAGKRKATIDPRRQREDALRRFRKASPDILPLTSEQERQFLSSGRIDPAIEREKRDALMAWLRHVREENAKVATQSIEKSRMDEEKRQAVRDEAEAKEAMERIAALAGQEKSSGRGKKKVVVASDGIVLWNPAASLRDLLGIEGPGLLPLAKALKAQRDRSIDDKKATDKRGEQREEKEAKAKEAKRALEDKQKAQAQAMKDLRRAEIEADLASFEAKTSAAKQGLALSEQLFGKNRALEAANAVIQGAVETARAASAFALGNVPGGIAHLFAATQWAVVAAKAGGGGGGVSGARPPTAGGGFVGGGTGGGFGGSENITVNISGVVGDKAEVGAAITGAIRTARKAGRARPMSGAAVFQN